MFFVPPPCRSFRIACWLRDEKAGLLTGTAFLHLRKHPTLSPSSFLLTKSLRENHHSPSTCPPPSPIPRLRGASPSSTETANEPPQRVSPEKGSRRLRVKKKLKSRGPIVSSPKKRKKTGKCGKCCSNRRHREGFRSKTSLVPIRLSRERERIRRTVLLHRTDRKK